MRPSHRTLSAWYHQLAQQLEAGVSLPQAFRQSGGTGVAAARREAMAAVIDRGGSADDALRTAESWLPLADMLALSAAANAGRMPGTLHHLSERHAKLGAAKFRLVLACAYPLAMLHLGLLLLPLMRMIDWDKGFQWSAAAYVRSVALSLLPLWVVAAVVWIMARHDSFLLVRVVRLLPVFGGYLRAQALADLSFALANFLEAGVAIGDAWAAAGLTTRSPDLRAGAKSITETIARGAAPGGTLAGCGCFPAEFVALYQSGEQTGQLDRNLHRLAAQYQDAASRALTMTTLVYPAIAFLAVAGAVVYHAVRMYAGYLKMIEKMVE